MGTQCAFVDFFVALSSISIEAFVAFACESRVFVTVFGFFWCADGIGRAFVGSVQTIVGFLTGCFSQLGKVWLVQLRPIIVTLFLDFVNNSFKGMSPVASSSIFGIIDEFTSENTSFFGALNSSFCSFSESTELLCDQVPVVSSREVIV